MSEARVLFLLPSAPGRDARFVVDARSVVQEAGEMRKLSADAQVATISTPQPADRTALEEMEEGVDRLVSYCADEEELVEHAGGFDVVVATAYHSVAILERVVASNPAILPAYYVQDYEPTRFEVDPRERHQDPDAYRLIPRLVLFAWTEWLCEEVAREHRASVAKVLPGIDRALFRPPLGDEVGPGPVRVVAMAGSAARRDAAGRAMRVLNRLRETFADEIEIHVVGGDDAEIDGQEPGRDPPFTRHGRLSPRQAAALLRRAQIYVDLTDRQAFARTGLEAMAAGCGVVVPAGGGAEEFVVDGENGILVSPSAEDGYYMAVAALLLEPSLRRRLGARGVDDALQYPLARAAASQLAVLGDALSKRDRRRSRRMSRPLRLSVFTPSRAGITPGSSYVRVLQPLSHPRVAREIAPDHRALDDVLCGRDPADAVLVQRTAIPSNRATALVGHLRRRNRQLIMEIDDDLLLLDSDEEYEDQLPGLRALLEVAAVVTVATPRLSRVIAEHTNAAIAVVPNALDERLWFSPRDRPDRHGADRDDGEGGSANRPVRILYMGTATHSADLELLRPALRLLRDEAGLDVELEVIGGESPGEGQEWYRRVDVPWAHAAYPHFVSWLRAEAPRWDLAVAPLVDSEFNRSKSDLKFLEYSALGLPSVVSDVEPYRGCRDAIRVTNEPPAWAQAISRLAHDASHREAIAGSARKQAREKRCLDTAPNALLDAISAVR